ncbi:MAG TPA: insulinase family protein [Gammaproteobacteria bacterium]|nr:insulinase family protein [Gammaproteobacteria bacterium]
MLRACRNRARPFLLIATLTAVAAFWPAAHLAAQDDFARARAAPLDQALPTSAEVTTGALDNGLRYFIRKSSEPKNRAFLRLVINAGSVLEDENERGAAHFLEHMAFNGTERFPKDELVSFMESIGMRLGAGLNARTSFDDTVYMLVVPTDVPANLEKSFEILEDWAGRLALDPAEIASERGVVLEEWRAGRGAGARISDKHLPVLYKGSRYADRLPIGTPEAIQAMDRDKLLGFYRKWYRPELMAVIAVGDFDAARIEKLIRTGFASLRAPAQAPPRVVYDVPAQTGTAFSIAADPEQTSTSVALVRKMPPDNDWTVGGFRRYLVEQIYNGLLNLRFQEIARQPAAPFIGASSQTTRPVRQSSAYQLSAAVLDNGVEGGLGAILAESERVARFGFTATELERAKTSILRGMESRWAARDSRTSASFAEEYTDAFLLQHGSPSLEYERGLNERFVPEITLEEVNAVGRGWLGDSNRVVLVTAPEKAGLKLPEQAALGALIAAAANAKLEPYVDKGSGSALVDEPPSGSKVVAERKRSGGVTEWDLANGVRVVLKPTDFNKDQVIFRGFVPGGGSLVADDDLVAAQTATPVLTAGGLSNLDVTALQKALTGKVAQAAPSITEYEAAVAGQASVKDLQTLFELIYLRFTEPRADPNAFAAVQNQARQALMNRDANPAVAFNDAFNRIMTRDSPRARPLTVESVPKMSLERSLAIYRDVFSNARGATFVFVGAFDLEAIKPLVEQYVGGLPAAAKPGAWRDLGIRPPDGVVEQTVRKGIEPRAQTRIVFHGPIDMHDLRNPTVFNAMAILLQNQLREALREDLGGTYGVAVAPNVGWLPVESYVLVIEFACDPARADALAARIFTEIAALKAGPPAAKVADVRAAMLRGYETSQRQNAWWLTGLASSYQFDPKVGPDNLLAFGAVVEKLTPQAIRDAARQYIDTKNYVRVTLLPETAAASAPP